MLIHYFWCIIAVVMIMNKQLSKDFIINLSKIKNEPDWMLEFRLKSYEQFLKLDNPSFGPIIDFSFDDILYYKNDQEKNKENWDEVNENVRTTFCNLGVIDAEEKYLDGVSNQYESEVIYHKQKTDKDIIFLSTDEALQKYPELFRKYFNTLVKYDENKYTALNGAVWSGGTFIYIPKDTHLDRPLQSYFRIDTENLGQFERTIIVVEDNSSLEYIEGCTARSYSSNSLHAGVVEIFVGKNAHMRYSTIQNWSTDVYNLVTKRAIVDDYGKMEWIDGNIGSKVTMKYPSCILKGDYATGNSLSVAYAKKGQALDAGAKMIHLGCHTKSNIVSKSLAENGGVANYRGTVHITKKASDAISEVKCDTILLDDCSVSDTYPTNIVENETSRISHEAAVAKIDQEKLFYLMSQGLTEERAKELIIMGFISDFKKELPMEYAVELNRLINS